MALSGGKRPGNINGNQSNEITPTDCLKNTDNDGNHNSKNLTNKIFNFLGIAGFLWLFFTLIVMFRGMYYDVKICKIGTIQELHESQFNKVKDVYATVLFDDGNTCIFKLYNPGYKVGDEISVNIKQSNDYIYASEGH